MLDVGRNFKSFLFLLIALLGFQNSLYAECSLPESSAYECKGRITVTNDEELAAYLVDYGYNENKSLVRGVLLSGSFSGETLSVSSPCQVKLAEGTSLNYTGDICLSSPEHVILAKSVSVTAANVNLLSQKRIVALDGFTANLTGDLNLLSTGTTEDSRVHIRSNSSVTAHNLSLKALRRATIGHSSVFNLSGKLSILSNGEDLSSDVVEGTTEWSSIWRDTTVNASEIEVIAEDQARVATGVNLSADKITLDGLTCRLNGNAVVTSENKLGSCFDDSLPVVKLKRGAIYKEILVGDLALLSGEASTYEEGASFYWRYKKDDLDWSEWSEGEVSKSVSFDEAGVYRISLKVVNPDGHYAFATRKIWVNDPAPAILAFFKFYLTEPESDTESPELKLVYESRSLNDLPIVSAQYSTPEGETLDVGRLVLGHVDSIPFESDESLDITLTVTNSEGTTESITHTINPVKENQSPYLSIDSLEYSANSVLFFSNLIFDPYDQLGDVSAINFDFGDESSKSLEDFDGANFKIDHNYAEASEYEVSLNIENEEGETFSHQETIEVLGEEDSYSTILPFADFRVDKASWAPGTRIYVDQSLSPLSPIVTYLWNLGDGTTAYGEEVLHFYDEGAYDVSLTVITEDGTSKTITREIIILSDATNVMANLDCWQTDILKIECDLMGLAREENLSNLMIHFGDSELSEENASVYEVSGSYGEVNLEYEYDASGEYTITYAAFTNAGDEITQEITVNVLESSGNEAPIADLACYQADGLSVDCQAFGSLDNDGYIVNYFYDFGDGNTLSTSDSQTYYTYADYGTYEVNLTVTDNLGDSSSTSYSVAVVEAANQFPEAYLSCASNGIQELTCNAMASTDPDGEIAAVRITFLEDDDIYESEDYQNFEVTKTFSSGGSKEVKLEVMDDDGAITEFTSSYTVNSNASPIAIISCSSSSRYSLYCSGSSSYDEDGIISGYNWIIDGESYEGESVSLEGITKSSIDIELSVYDEHGKVGVTNTAFEDIKQNVPPEISISCSSNSFWTISCINNTEDYESDELQYEWTIGENKFSTKNIDNFYLGYGGDVAISLKVSDSYDLSEYTETVSVLENLPPLITLSCESSKTNSLECSRSAADPEGAEVTSSWYIDDVEINESSDNLYYQVESSEVIVKVVSTDSHGQSSVETVVVEVNREDVAISFSCNQISNYSSSCSPTLYNLSSSGLEYSWSLDGVVVSSSEVATISFTSVGTYEISLQVSSSSESFSDSLSHEVVEMDAEDIESSLTMTLIEEESLFYPLETELRFSIEGGDIGVDDSGKTFSAFLSYEGVEADVEISEAEYISGELTIPVSFNEGLNKIDIKIKDSYGHWLYWNGSVYAGSKSLTVSITNYTNDESLAFYLLDQESDDPIIVDTSESYFSLENVPAIGILVSSGEYPYNSISLLNADETLLSIDHIEESLSDNLDNLDFSNDLDGWEITRGDATVILGDNQSLNSVQLSPDEDGIISGKTLLTGLNDETFYELPFRFNSSDSNSFVFLKSKNLSTGVENVSIFSKSEFEGVSIPVLKFNLPEISSSNDQILLEFFSKLKVEDELTVFQKIMNSLPFSPSYANTEEEYFIVYVLKNYALRISSFVLKDGQQHDKGSVLKTFIQSPFPLSYSQYLTNKKETKVYKVGVSFDLESDNNYNLNSLSFFLEACSNVGDCYDYKDISCSDIKLGYNNCLIIFKEADLVGLTQNPYVMFRLVAYYSGEDFSSNYARASNNTQRFKILKSLSASGIVGGENESVDRYGKREGSRNQDALDGGDDWYSIAHGDIIRNIMFNTSMIYNGESYNIKVDDISPTGVSTPKKFGHHGHGSGIELDLRFSKENELLGYSEILQSQNSSHIGNFKEDAEGLINILNAGEGYIDYILIENIILSSHGGLYGRKYDDQSLEGKLTHVSGSDDEALLVKLASSCTDKNEYALNKAFYASGHSNHMHITLNELDKNATINQFDFSSFNSEISNDESPSVNETDSSGERTYKVTYKDPNEGYSLYTFNGNFSNKVILFYWSESEERYMPFGYENGGQTLFQIVDRSTFKTNKNHEDFKENGSGEPWEEYKFKAIYLNGSLQNITCAERLFSADVPTGECSNEKNVYYGYNKSCVSCDTDNGYQWIEDKRQCVYCPSDYGTVLKGGEYATCDWDAPVLTIEEDEEAREAPTDCDGSILGMHQVVGSCTFNVGCKTSPNVTKVSIGGGEYVDIPGNFTLSGKKYQCLHDGNGWVLEERAEGEERVVTCTNPDGEVATEIVSCPY